MNLTQIKQKLTSVPVRKAKELRFAGAFLGLAGNILETDRVFVLEKAMLDLTTPEETAKVFNELKKVPCLAPMFAERYLAPAYTVESLKDYPTDSLGYAYYRHMTDNGFTPDYFPPTKPDSDLNFYRLRNLQTHDIWHVLTGCKTDIPGENRIVGFYMGHSFKHLGDMAAGNSVFNGLLLSATIFHAATRDPKMLPKLVQAAWEGFQLGQQAKPLWAAHWEEMWERPLREVQAEYGLLPQTAERELVTA